MSAPNVIPIKPCMPIVGIPLVTISPINRGTKKRDPNRNE